MNLKGAILLKFKNMRCDWVQVKLPFNWCRIKFKVTIPTDKLIAQIYKNSSSNGLRSTHYVVKSTSSKFKLKTYKVKSTNWRIKSTS